jgi:hypothetical protein
MEKYHEHQIALQRTLEDCALPNAPMDMPVQALRRPGRRGLASLLAAIGWSRDQFGQAS